MVRGRQCVFYRELIGELGTVASRVNYGQVGTRIREILISLHFSFLPLSTVLLVQWDLLGWMATCGRLKEATLGFKIDNLDGWHSRETSDNLLTQGC